ncbi:SDR family oxidoreductase [Dongshaea marina]|uniref:SDR family oxidoreductase n=1 Tax=Dongshaea marina TaxID=2047966 RepID=UPI000D3E5468|nr:SDR family oxidoreductase [Dongshaea marina]
MSEFKDKVVVITGGSSGIGLETAKLFHKEGAQVVIMSRTAEALDKAAAEIGSNVMALKVDVASVYDLEQAAATIKEVYGRVDVLFSSAGIAPMLPFEMVSEEIFDAVVNANFKGAFFTVQKISPLMPEGSSIILTSSTVASTGVPNFSVYSASKAAVRSLGRTLTSDLASKKIRVNTISPGPIETPMLDKTGLTKEQMNGFKEMAVTQTPVGRFGYPTDIAEAVMFFASEKSSFITGVELTVDGGRTQI